MPRKGAESAPDGEGGAPPAASAGGPSERRIEFVDGAVAGSAVYLRTRDFHYFMRIRRALTRACIRLAQVMEEAYRREEQRKVSPLVLALVCAREVFQKFGVPHCVRPLYRVTRKVKAPAGVDQAALDERLEQVDYSVRHAVVLSQPPPLFDRPEDEPTGASLTGVVDPRLGWATLQPGDGAGAAVPDALRGWLVTDITSLEDRARVVICGTPAAVEREKVADVLVYTPEFAETPVGVVYRAKTQASDVEIVAYAADFDENASDSWREMRDLIVKAAMKEQDAKTDHLAKKFRQKALDEARSARVRMRAKERLERDRAARKRAVQGTGVPQLRIEDMQARLAAIETTAADAAAGGGASPGEGAADIADLD